MEMSKQQSLQSRAELLTLDQTCEILNLKRSKLRSLVFKNQIPVIRIGKCLRFCIKDLQIWLDEKKSYSLEA